jgi:hypothetical protein
MKIIFIDPGWIEWKIFSSGDVRVNCSLMRKLLHNAGLIMTRLEGSGMANWHETAKSGVPGAWVHPIHGRTGLNPHPVVLQIHRPKAAGRNFWLMAQYPSGDYQPGVCS